MFSILQGSWCQRLPQLVGRLHANRWSLDISHDRGVVIRSHQAFQSLRMKPWFRLRREHPQVWSSLRGAVREWERTVRAAARLRAEECSIGTG